MARWRLTLRVAFSAYGNLLGAPWEWTKAPEFADFIRRRIDVKGDMLRMQTAFDVTGDPAFPEKAAFEVARDFTLPVTTHAGVWGIIKNDSIRMAASPLAKRPIWC